MIQKIKTILKEASNYKREIIIVLLLLFLIIEITLIFEKQDSNVDTTNKKLVELEYKYNIAIQELNRQKDISDSLIEISNLKITEIVYDTVVINKINIKYEKQKINNRELSADEQLQFSSEWLSKEDSVEK